MTIATFNDDAASMLIEAACKGHDYVFSVHVRNQRDGVEQWTLATGHEGGTPWLKVLDMFAKEEYLVLAVIPLVTLKAFMVANNFASWEELQ